MASNSDTIVAVHIPQVVPEMMLSSMSEPGDVHDDAFAALLNLPSKAGRQLQAEVQQAADDEMAKMGKQVEISYKVGPSAVDCKAGLLQVCKEERANMVFLGPGVGGNGSMPPFVAANARGFSVCIVRDAIE